MNSKTISFVLGTVQTDREVHGVNVTTQKVLVLLEVLLLWDHSITAEICAVKLSLQT